MLLSAQLDSKDGPWPSDSPPRPFLQSYCHAMMDRNPEYNPDMVGILPITRMTYGHPERLHGNDKPYLEA